MRSWMLISVLLLSLLIHEAQAGIRLIRKGTPSNVQHIISPIKTLKERGIDGVEEAIQCRANECSGRVRKLLMNTRTNAKNNKNEERVATKEENMNGSSSSSTTEQREPGPGESYPGVLDIAGMDYSQARRKPPIHN